MNKKFITDIRILKRAIAEKKLVVFAGSGISIDSGAPSWEKLIHSLQSEIGIPKDEKDLLKIAQIYFNEKGNKKFIDKIREVFGDKELKYNAIHEAIFELEPEHIITTNFDSLLEQVIKAKGYPYSIIVKDDEFPSAQNTKLLVKIHGDLAEGDLVIKEDDYTGYSQSHPLTEIFIKNTVVNKVILFIGYSFSDINMKIVFHYIRNILGNNFQNAYMLSIEDNIHPTKRQYLKNKGINLINFHDGDIEPNRNAIEEYLYKGENALNRTFMREKNNLSEYGERLLKMIKFITKYLVFEESVVNENILTQMYLSFERFNEVHVLPPKFLGNLFPFNNTESFIHNYRNNILGSNNKQVNKFFFNEFNETNLRLKENFYEKNKIPINNKKKMGEYLTAVVEKLNRSNIFYFGKTDSKIELFEYPKEFTKTIDILLPTRNCNCLNCLYSDFKIKEFLKELKEGTITETSEIHDDFLLAYSNHKAGNFTLSYLEFEQIANKSWQQEKFLSYFIAKLNSKTLRNLVLFFSDANAEEVKNKIKESTINIDLDKILTQIPSLDHNTHELLKSIKDNDVLTKAQTDINEYYDKIIRVDDIYKKGGFSVGPTYHSLVLESLIWLFSFYNDNYIIMDEFDDFRRIFQKGLKTLLISYSLDDKYEGKLKMFDSIIIKFMILYGDTEEIQKAIRKFNINNINVVDQDLPIVTSYLNNLFESFFNESQFKDGTIESDKNLSAQTNGFYFGSRVRTMLNNAFILFGLIKTNAKQSKVLVRNFLEFLKVQNILIPFDQKYFNSFLNNIIEHFTFEDFVEILQVSVDTEAGYLNDGFYRIIGKQFVKRFPDSKLDNEDLIKAIIVKSIQPAKNRHERGFIFLWKTASDANKLLIENALTQDISKHFNPDDYLWMNYERIISLPEFSSNYIELLERYIPEVETSESIQSKYTKRLFFNFVNLIYSRNFFEGGNYPRFNEYPEFWKFYLKPFDYDYSNFNPKWLLIVNVEHVHKKLCKIKEIKDALKKGLKNEFDKELSEIYVKYYM